MKILFYINILAGGGAERVVANISTYLAEKNDVTVINSFKTESEYPISQKVNHVYIDDNSYKSSLSRNIGRIRFLRRWIKENKPDVCLSFMAEPNIRLLIATLGLKTKTVISVRNDPNREYGGRVLSFLAKKLLPKADGCVFQTEDAKAWFPKKLRDKSTIILNPANPIFFNTEYGGEKKDIVTCGRLSKQKNHVMLIEAFASIKDKITDNLIIYGEGDEKQALKEKITRSGLVGRVFLPGNTSDVPNAIKSAKCFVLSSDFEGMPNALMEAMAIGLPAVSTDCPCGGPKTIIENGTDGILVPVGDKEEMAKAILNICSDEEFAATLAKNAASKAKLLFDSEKIDKQWENYIEAIGNKGQKNE